MNTTLLWTERYGAAAHPLRERLAALTFAAALLILVAGAAVMVPPIYRYAQRMDGIGLAQQRNGIVAQQVGRLTALPFDSLASRAGCVSVARPPLPHTRCVTLTVLSARQTRVRLVITPVSTMIRPDTVLLERTRAVTANPFST